MNLERYYTVVLRNLFTTRQAMLVVAAIWGFTWICVSLVPLYTLTYPIVIALQPCRGYCLLAWHTVSPIMIFLNSVFVLMVTGVLISIAFVHYKLISMLHKSAHGIHEPNGIQTHKTTTQSSISQETSNAISKIMGQGTHVGSTFGTDHFEVQIANILHQQEKVINHQAKVMSLSFSICWGSYFLMVLFVIVTQTPVNRAVDAFFSLGPILNSTLNPILLYLLDNRVRSHVQQISETFPIR
jgi:hypothetical protein